MFKDIGVSGVTPLGVRPGWGALMERLSEVDGIIVEPLDRISRDPGQLLDVLRRLEAMGKVIISVSDNGGGNQLLKINDPDLRRVIMDIASILIKQERLAASERTKEKLAKLKAEGKRLGRPPRSSEVKRRLIELAEKGVTLKEACRIAGVNYGTALRYLSHDPDYLKAKYTARLGRLISMQELNKTSLTTETLKTNNLEDLN